MNDEDLNYEQDRKTTAKARRIALGLSIDQFAHILGVTGNYVYKIEAPMERRWSRYVPDTVLDMLGKLEDGFRPETWPTELRQGKRGRPRGSVKVIVNAEAAPA